jgi:hypothetical protein
MSIRPNPDDLLQNRTIPDNGSGFTTLDGQITHLLGTCPDHAELTCWHEAQSDNPLHYPKYITAANMRAIDAHVQKLCAKTPDADGGRVKYGCIPSSSPKLRAGTAARGRGSSRSCPPGTSTSWAASRPGRAAPRSQWARCPSTADARWAPA